MPSFNTKSSTRLAVLALLLGAARVIAAGAEDAPAVTHTPIQLTPATSAGIRAVTPEIAASTAAQRETWRLKLVHTARPKKACYTATYPETQWREVACTIPPHRFFGPRRGPMLDTVGNGNDYVAQPASPITLANGSFDSVTNATSLATQGAGTGGVNGNNFFTLQLNSNFFTTSVCSGGASSCKGFAQFVYDNSSSSAYIQYWLVSYGSAACPGGWSAYGGDCVRNASNGVAAPMALSVADLHDMKLTGSAASGGSLMLYVGGSMVSTPGDDILPDLASNWGDAEFNVFGDGGGGQAVFNSGATLVVRTQVETGSNILPDCVIGGWTLETNNLNLVSTPTVVPKQQYPSIVFDESNAAGTSSASCSTSVGDTHVTTFDGLYYDFQASGDFILADAGPDFIVQARQESGAKVFNNPNVTMNTAVAVRMGANRIAIYDDPPRVLINGKLTSVADNAIVTLPGDVYLMRGGSAYVVTRATGEMMRAQLYNGWLDVTVGLGHRPRANTHGILASPSNVALAMRNGTQLRQPVSAVDLYQRYAPSWLVQPKESLFAEQTVKYVAPAKLFYASDLAPQVYEQARAACAAAGVTDGTHLDACTLDAAVLKNTIAVKAFTHAIPPRIALRPVGPISAIEPK